MTDELPNNKEAVIAIQGGGVHGLTLLGQMKAVIENGYSPMAYAGNSGGAIVATLLWSGLPPEEIEAAFLRLRATSETAFINLLQPFESPPARGFDFAALSALKGRIVGLVERLPSLPGDTTPTRAPWLRRAIAWPINATASAVSHVALANAARVLWGEIKPHIPRRGFFQGIAFERLIDQLVRDGLKRGYPDLDQRFRREEFIRFSHVTQLMRERKLYRPPLVLTATNLSRRRLEIISSSDPAYGNVPVAAAVRASAGFPVFFRPKELPEIPDGGIFVDGGVVSNFPLWTFSEVYRHRLAAVDYYQHLAMLPWMRVGLRVVDEPVAVADMARPRNFFGALVAMMASETRNQLEEELSARTPRSIVIRQPTSTTGGPDDILDIAALDEAKIREMVGKGYDYARAHLEKRGAPGIYRPDVRVEIEAELSSIVVKCGMILKEDAQLRANVFVPDRGKLKMAFSFNMNGDPDQGLVLPSVGSGISGSCYQSRRIILGNLTKVAALAQRRDKNWPSEIQDRIRKDRTWVISAPVFDPHEVKLSKVETGIAGIASSGLDGPLLGVVSMDAALDYEKAKINPDVDFQVQDPRISVIFDIVQAGASRIANVLTASTS